MVARIAPLAVVVLVLVVACYDDPVGVLKPDGARPSHTSATPSGSGIFDGAESFVAGNPMRNFAGGAPYNYGYYSDGPDPGDGWNDSDQARIAIPHDSLLVDLSNFSFETWVRVSYSSEWEYGVIAVNSNHQTNSTGQLDLGYFALDYEQYSPGLMEFAWRVSSYSGGVGGWSVIRASPPPLDPDSGRVMHVVGVHDANVISLYIDGSLAATADISFRQDLSDIFSWGGDIEKPLMIAGSQCAQDDPSCNVSLAGSIGESAFYRRALTPTEIQEHYQVGTGTPPTEPDSLNDPYRDLVLSHQPDGYWRHRESHLHGLASIEGQQVVDDSGHNWHGTYAGIAAALPPPDPCTDSTVAVMQQEYLDHKAGFQPACDGFSTRRDTTHFTWEELNDNWSKGSGHEPWGLVTTSLLKGLEATRTNYGSAGIMLTSGYRCPHGNKSVGGAKKSLHMRGWAADMYSLEYGTAWTEEQFLELHDAALTTGPKQLFDYDKYDDHHLHAAWEQL